MSSLKVAEGSGRQAVGRVPRLGMSLDRNSVLVRLIDGELNSPGFPFHASELEHHVEVELENPEMRGRVILIRALCENPLWKENFVKWIVPKVTIPDQDGGSTVEELVERDSPLGSAWVYVPPASNESSRKRKFWLMLAPTAEMLAPNGRIELEVEALEFGDDGHAEWLARRAISVQIVNETSKLANQLPAIYHDHGDEEAATSFLHRFMLGFDVRFTEFDSFLNRVHDLFGAFTAPSSQLVGLAEWVAMTIDDSWSEMKRRVLIKEAFHLYSIRGTKKGLARLLQIYSGAAPIIVDKPTSGLRLGAGHGIGSPQAKLGSLAPGEFMVTVAVPSGGTVREETVRMLIEMVKPAHTRYSLLMVPHVPGEGPFSKLGVIDANNNADQN